MHAKPHAVLPLIALVLAACAAPTPTPPTATPTPTPALTPTARALATARAAAQLEQDLAQGEIYLNAGDYAGAQLAYERALERTPDTTTARIGLARALAGLGELREALQTIGAVLDDEPTNPEALLARGDIRAQQARADRSPERFEDAIADYTAAIEAGSTAAYAERADALVNLGRDDEAIPDYTEAIALDGDNAALYTDRARAYTNAGQPEAALRDYDTALELNPFDPETYTARADLYLDDGDYIRALADLEQALSLAPDYTRALFRRGIAYVETGQVEQGVTDFNRIIALDPTDSANLGATYFYLGAIAEAQGRTTDAIANFEQFLTLNPFDGEAHDYARDRIEQLSDDN